jgi:NTP pyrophosphatase (non-canonical NTP hydrolase)
MKPAEYIKLAMLTDLDEYQVVLERLKNPQTLMILHAALGLSTEAAEILDALKKHLIYGKPLDLVNLMEETGDTFWYTALLSKACNFTFEEVMEKNIAKLKARYGEKFNEKDALERDLDRERKILESK